MATPPQNPLQRNILAQIRVHRSMNTNTFDPRVWADWVQPNYHGRPNPPHNVDECIGDPDPADTCVACGATTACACIYDNWVNHTRTNWINRTTIQPVQSAGFGLFASECIPAGTILDEYCGELVPEDPTVSNEESTYWSNIPCGPRPSPATRYGRPVEIGQCAIDAQNRGSATRFVNHSCVPLAAIFEGRVGTQRRVKYVQTIVDIDEYQEIFVDYGEEWLKAEPHCWCGEKNCRKPNQAGGRRGPPPGGPGGPPPKAVAGRVARAGSV
ncbi:SET domain-containing protein [Byssothecium circinans]|uniref:SET domain-containing protein n=1 Tax=Byssothecium circinans TaxID=147558 RepID=A0A6A5TWU3_9PLEO|nr:SET domain-containing protein [Byssothecium circinans]